MKEISASEAREALYNIVREELLPLYDKIRLAVINKETYCIYHNLSDLQIEYLKDKGFNIVLLDLKVGFNTDTIGPHYKISW